MRRNRFDRVLAGTLLAALVLGVPAVRAASKTYQVTGPVTEVTADTITVQKGKDLWQLTRNADTKAPTAPKVGDKVTITYSMTAVNIAVAVAPAAKPAADKAAAPADGAAKPAAGKPAATPPAKRP